MQYIDITNNYKINKEYIVEKENKYIDSEGNKYQVDGKHVIMSPSIREEEVATLLGEIFGGKIYIIPRVNYPKNIKTPDYVIDNERYDLKTLRENNEHTIYNAIHKQKRQANNFIIDISQNGMPDEEAIKQITNVYDSKNTKWVSKIVLIKEKEILKIYKRK